MYEKVSKCPNFTWFLPEKYQNTRIFEFALKINKIPDFLKRFCPKNARFLQLPEKYLFPIFFFWGGGHVAPCLPRLLCLWTSPSYDVTNSVISWHQVDARLVQYWVVGTRLVLETWLVLVFLVHIFGQNVFPSKLTELLRPGLHEIWLTVARMDYTLA